MSSTPRKITRYKWTTWINDMPKVEPAIGSILVTIEHKQSDTRLEYQDLLYFRIAYDTFWIVPIRPSSRSLKSFPIWSAISKRMRVYPTPSTLSAILCELCFWFKIFLLRQNNPVNRWGPLVCLLGFCPSGPKPCRGSKTCMSLAKQTVSRDNLSFSAYDISQKRSANQQKQFWKDAFHVKTSHSVKK